MKALTKSGEAIECAEVTEGDHGIVLHDGQREQVGYVPYDRLDHVLETRTPVSSSSLSSVGYDDDADVLEIAFHSGGVYRYRDVSDEVYRDLLRANSKGQYFHEHVRGEYEYERIL